MPLPRYQPLLPITLPSTLASIKTYESPHPLTVLIASYPKSGTTWLQALVFELLALSRLRQTGSRVALSHISDYCPFLENDKSHVHATNSLQDNFLEAHNNIEATVFNTHLYLDAMPAPAATGTTKYLYATRSARDVCNSFYHHLSHQAPSDGGYTGSRSDFVKEWAQGEIAFGAWGDHLRAWLDDAGATIHPDCLLVSYEGMKTDLAATVAEVATHLDITALTEAELADVLPRLSVDYMKANIDKFQPKSVEWINKGDGFSFVRKGNVGDGKKEFSEADEALFVAGFDEHPPPAGCRHLI